jgi:hypothetical protein
MGDSGASIQDTWSCLRRACDITIICIPINAIELLKSPTEQDYLGIYSIMFWTLTLIGVVKYTSIALKADDQGEGLR